MSEENNFWLGKEYYRKKKKPNPETPQPSKEMEEKVQEMMNIFA